MLKRTVLRKAALTTKDQLTAFKLGSQAHVQRHV